MKKKKGIYEYYFEKSSLLGKIAKQQTKMKNVFAKINKK